MTTETAHHSADDAGARRPLWARLVWWLAALALAGLAIPVLARLFGVEAAPLAYAIALMPWVTLGLLVPLALALAVRSWPLAGVAGALLALCIAWLAPLYVSSGGEGEPALRVASVSMTFGLADADAVVALVREHDIDLLALQEVTPASVDALAAAGLDDLLPFSEVHAEPGFTGTGLWSKGAMTDASSLGGFVSHAIRATVSTTTGDLTVFSIHPAAPGSRANTAWNADHSRLSDVLTEVTGPVLVVGDFNATRDHRAFRHLESIGYVDAANQAGAGFQPTFPEHRLPFALVAIDHVMVRDAPLRAISVETTSVPGADHRPVVVVYTHE